MTAYYNEIDPHAAAWLRNLIVEGIIADGEVDERSVSDVCAADLLGFTQCHFFAGIGAWSQSLRLAGWPDDRPVWTGSCPCQPFSGAGRGAGFADVRHLWPHWFHLVEQHRPSIVFGEQVEGKSSGPWVDLVQDDLEGVGYAFGAVPFPAASVGAPHRRHRLYWVADANGQRFQGREPLVESARRRRLADADGAHLDGVGDASDAGLPLCEREALGGTGWRGEGRAAEQPSRAPDGLDNASRIGRREKRGVDDRHVGQQLDAASARQPAGALSIYNPWRDADWLGCKDGKWRPVEPGTFPLANGAAGRVGRLRAYGNAIVAPQAAAFIRGYMTR